MKPFGVAILIAFLWKQGTVSASSTSVSAAAAATTSTDDSPPYSITALPAVIAQSPCVFNCLIPIGLADPSGCDDVTENCACLSAPSDALDVLTDCVQMVCKSSVSQFQANATSLYQSYCQSIYGTMSLSSATVAESAAAAASSSSSSSVTATEASSAMVSPTKKSESGVWLPPL